MLSKSFFKQKGYEMLPGSLRPKLIHSPTLTFRLSISSFVLSFAFLLYTLLAQPSDEKCVHVLFPNSLASEVVKYHWTNLHDYYSPRSRFRGPPTPEREAFWDDISPYGVVSAPVGEETDRAVPGVILHMNCLKTIRQSVYDSKGDNSVEDQVDQCIEVLRDYLVCTCDATPYLIIEKPESSRGIVPVTANRHYCRNVDDILEWSVENFIGGGPGNFRDALVADASQAV